MRDVLWRRPERRLPTLVLLGAAVALLTALAVSLAQGGSPAQAQQVPPEQPFIPAELVLDHFTCYEIDEQLVDNPSVVVVDQFQGLTSVLVTRAQFCTPVRKDRLDTQEVRRPQFPFAHLTCYDLADLPPIDRVADIEHQFGAQQLTLRVTEDESTIELLSLCVPSRKLEVDGNPEPPAPVPPETVLDHYLCYELDPGQEILLPPVRLADQFVTQEPQNDPDAPFETESFCNPATKTHGGSTFPPRFGFAHLTCHNIDPTEGPLTFTITAADQFGTYTFTTRRLEYVCTPSMKEGAPPPPELVLNHFKCYQVNGKFDKRTVGLTDQFGTTQTLVKKVDSLCNPVRKTFAGETAPIRDGGAHLECLDIKEAKDPSVGRTVEVTNQFGTERLLVQKPATLCVPTAKTETAADPGPIPRGLDHFKCYDVKGEGLVKRDVILADQFGKEQVDAMHAQLLCNPVEKRHGTAVFTPRFPFAHLVCYQITPRGPFGPRNVRVRNQFQFGLRDLHVVSPRTLCLPSTKEPI